MAITVTAGSAVLLGMSSSLQSTQTAIEKTVGQGLAQQLLDEISSKFYCATKGSPYEYPMGCSTYEAGGVGRERYTDLDDFNGVRTEPAKGPYGIQLGKDDSTGGTRPTAMQAPGDFFARYRQEVDVYYVSNSDPATKLTAGQTSGFRCVEVRIYYDDPTTGLRPVTTLKKVFAYVDPP